MLEYIREVTKVIRDNQQLTGAYPASPNFENYQYTWFRDGSFTADAMSRAGNIRSAEHFFSWAAKVIVAHKEKIEAGEQLNTRYTYEGKEVEDEWAEFQIDGYGIFLWALRGHIERHHFSKDAYKEAVELTQLYLEKQWQNESYDWWEERKGVHPATLACVYAGLHAYNNPLAKEVKRAISLKDARTDGSLIVCALFDAVDESEATELIENIEHDLVGVDGGVYRYADDTYYGGGQWPVLTALLGMYYLKTAQLEKVKTQLVWCLQQINEHYYIPEQSHEHMLHPKAYQEWVDKAGPLASPLLWSHAMVASLMIQIEVLGRKADTTSERA